MRWSRQFWPLGGWLALEAGRTCEGVGFLLCARAGRPNTERTRLQWLVSVGWGWDHREPFVLLPRLYRRAHGTGSGEITLSWLGLFAGYGWTA